MIHPTRTNLLMLKDKSRSIVNSIGILKARKQALIREFLAATLPFLRSREDIKRSYGRAIRDLAVSNGRQGKDAVGSIAIASARDFGIEVKEKSIWGLKYKDIAWHDAPVRKPGERGYDELQTTLHLDACVNAFEKLLENMLHLAEYESKLKRLGDEIVRTSRRIKVLEEMVLPKVKRQIRTIGLYIGERERESFYRLKRVKGILERKQMTSERRR